MTSAHRPTFDPARGKEAKRGPAYHQRLLPAHTILKTRQPGQGGDADYQQRDLRVELLAAEAAALAKKIGTTITNEAEDEGPSGTKRQIERGEEEEIEDPELKRRRLVLEEAAELDADSAGSESDESSDEEDDDEDDELALMMELEKIKKERAEQRAKEEAEKAAKEQEEREYDIAVGNPLLNSSRNQDFNVKRRWDDDVVFKNQARGTEDNKSKEFVNDLLRSDFHKRFMSRYVR